MGTLDDMVKAGAGNFIAGFIAGYLNNSDIDVPPLIPPGLAVTTGVIVGSKNYFQQGDRVSNEERKFFDDFYDQFQFQVHRGKGIESTVIGGIVTIASFAGVAAGYATGYLISRSATYILS